MSLRETIRSACRFLFGDSARAFGSLSVLLLVLLAIVPAKDHFREWLRYQREYQSVIRNRSDAVSLARRFQGGVQQIWLPELGVVWRKHFGRHYPAMGLFGVTELFEPYALVELMGVAVLPA